MKVVELVTLSIELEENLYQQLYKFMKSNPDWGLERVLSESLGLFLQNESGNRVPQGINYRGHNE